MPLTITIRMMRLIIRIITKGLKLAWNHKAIVVAVLAFIFICALGYSGKTNAAIPEVEEIEITSYKKLDDILDEYRGNETKFNYLKELRTLNESDLNNLQPGDIIKIYVK